MNHDHAFKDHFSGHADAYARARPTYPPHLFRWLASLCTRHDRAWDVGCGNGQAAIALTEHFRDVLATDASAPQIAQAKPAAGVSYRIAVAHQSPAADASCDLVAVAQAAHWFDLPAFYREVRRVARPGAVLALWCYELARVNPQVDAVVDHLYQRTLAEDWPPERRLVESGYRTIDFPFQEIDAPAMAMHARWSAAQYLAYLGSWSAIQRHTRRTGANPLDAVAPSIMAGWCGDEVSVRWPLSFRVGRL